MDVSWSRRMCCLRDRSYFLKQVKACSEEAFSNLVFSLETLECVTYGPGSIVWHKTPDSFFITPIFAKTHIYAPSLGKWQQSPCHFEDMTLHTIKGSKSMPYGPQRKGPLANPCQQEPAAELRPHIAVPNPEERLASSCPVVKSTLNSSSSSYPSFVYSFLLIFCSGMCMYIHVCTYTYIYIYIPFCFCVLSMGDPLIF